MRKIIMTTAMLALLASNAYAETIHVMVDGLVCSFCATSIEKTFKKQAAVEDVKVDLDTKLVTITTKPKHKFDDGTIKKLITDAGYTVTNIHREK